MAGRPARQVVKQADGQVDLEARCWVLLNLGLEGAIKLSLLIVHLTQDHVVLQEEFVSHTKSRKIKAREKKKGLLVRSQEEEVPSWPRRWDIRGGGAAAELALEIPQRV